MPCFWAELGSMRDPYLIIQRRQQKAKVRWQTSHNPWMQCAGLIPYMMAGSAEELDWYKQYLTNAQLMVLIEVNVAVNTTGQPWEGPEPSHIPLTKGQDITSQWEWPEVLVSMLSRLNIWLPYLVHHRLKRHPTPCLYWSANLYALQCGRPQCHLPYIFWHYRLHVQQIPHHSGP